MSNTLTIPGSISLTATLPGSTVSSNLGFTYVTTGSHNNKSTITLSTGSWSRLDSGSCGNIYLITGKNVSTSSISIGTNNLGTAIISTVPPGFPFIIPQLPLNGTGQQFWAITYSGSADLEVLFFEQ